MGGHAFAQASANGEPTLNTPRMSPADYERLKHIWLERISEFFPDGEVAVLAEAPEKSDYGDIDIFVALDKKVDFIEMAKQIRAMGIICRSSGKVQKCTLGVPMDGTTSLRPPVVYKAVTGTDPRKAKPSTSVTSEEYAQIDIEIISLELRDWHKFHSSYGDMVSLLGRIVTHLGFTISDRGFWLRMKELDASKTVEHVNAADRDGVILLSSDPKQVMSFLGLSADNYDAGFKTLNELFEWLGACRLLSPEAVKPRKNNASERHRQSKRDVFAKFFREWLPKHTDMNLDQDEQEQKARLSCAREKFLHEAVDFFDKRAEFDEKHTRLALQLYNAVSANFLRPFIAEHSGREGKQVTEIVRSFHRWLGFDADYHPHVLKVPHSDAESQLLNFLNEDKDSLRDPGGANRWVEEHWEELRTLERQRGKTAEDRHP